MDQTGIYELEGKCVFKNTVVHLNGVLEQALVENLSQMQCPGYFPEHPQKHDLGAMMLRNGSPVHYKASVILVRRIS